MPVSSIAAVLLRLYALNLAIVGLVQIPGMLMQPAAGSLPYTLLPSLASLVIGLVLWVITPALARLLARGLDAQATLTGVDETTLLRTIFVGLGLWFALSSFASIFNWLHYFAVSRSSIVKDGAEQSAPYDFWHQVLTCVAGVLLVSTSRIWAEKLTRKSAIKAS